MNIQKQVAIILPYHQLENQGYLDLFLQSLRNQGVNYQLIMIYSTPSPPSIPSDISGIFAHHPEAQTYAQKVNKATQYILPEVEHVFLAQDDIILSANCLAKLIRDNEPYQGVMNAASNCDNYWRYKAALFAPSNAEGKVIQLGRFMKLHEIKGFEEALMNEFHGPDIIMHVDFVCTYATLIPKKLWLDLKGMNENYINGLEDVDFCLRAAQRGARSTISFNAFTFHFGGATSEGKILPEWTKGNREYFKKTWGREAP